MSENKSSVPNPIALPNEIGEYKISITPQGSILFSPDFFRILGMRIIKIFSIFVFSLVVLNLRDFLFNQLWQVRLISGLIILSFGVMMIFILRLSFQLSAEIGRNRVIVKGTRFIKEASSEMMLYSGVINLRYSVISVRQTMTATVSAVSGGNSLEILYFHSKALLKRDAQKKLETDVSQFKALLTEKLGISIKEQSTLLMKDAEISIFG